MSDVSNDNQLCNLTLLGNLVAKPNIRYRANPALAITELTLATHNKWLDKKTNKMKEWTHYHQVTVLGQLVEQNLQQVEKGDVLLIQGYMTDNKKTSSQSITATFVQKFGRGYTESINQLHCSAKIITPISLMTSEYNKPLAQANVEIHHQVYCPIKQIMKKNTVQRTLSTWGRQAQLLKERSQIEDIIIIEAQLTYANTRTKDQLLDSKKIHLVKN